MADEWWLLADLFWAGPQRWPARAALAMRGPVAAGRDPVPQRDVPPGARTLTVAGTVLPGLQDTHVHSGLVDLRAVRRGGIAAVTDLGSIPHQVGALRRESLDPASDLPVVTLAGAFLTAPGGYPSDRSWAAPGSWRELRSAGDAAVAVAEQVAAGAGLIKVAINAEAGPVPAPPVLAAVAAATHAAGLPLVAHAQGTGTVRAALAAGADVLAHAPWTDPLGPELLRECARQTTWISTLTVLDPRGGGPAWTIASANLAGFLAAGGTVRYGTDLGNGEQRLGVSPDELDALQSVGMSVDEVLVSMTGPLTGPGGSPAGAPGASTPPAAPALPTASRFIAGLPPTLLPPGFGPSISALGPAMRQAQVFSQ